MTQTLSPATRLEAGQRFPALSAPLLGGDTLNLPGDARGAWSVVLLYRGDWCPYCRTQLTDFQRAAQKYAEAGVRVFSLSADTGEEAQKTAERHALTLPVAYGLNPGAVAGSHGASTGEDGAYLQATGFVLRPDGTVALSLYSSGAVGRLNAADTLRFIQYLQTH